MFLGAGEPSAQAVDPPPSHSVEHKREDGLEELLLAPGPRLGGIGLDLQLVTVKQLV